MWLNNVSKATHISNFILDKLVTNESIKELGSSDLNGKVTETDTFPWTEKRPIALEKAIYSELGIGPQVLRPPTTISENVISVDRDMKAGGIISKAETVETEKSCMALWDAIKRIATKYLNILSAVRFWHQKVLFLSFPV